MGERYNALPEALRWALFPALTALLSWFLSATLEYAMPGWFSINKILASAAFGEALPMFTYLLAPRWKPVFGWLQFAVFGCILGWLWLCLVALRGLAHTGVLPPFFAPPAGDVWGRKDWVELFRSICWSIASTQAFMVCRAWWREEATRSRLPTTAPP